MRTSRLLPGLFAAVSGLAACTADIHDNNATVNIPQATINVTTPADVSNVLPEATVPMQVTVTNVYLVEPAAVPPPEHEADAGHLQVYLDDTSTVPLMITAQVKIDVKVPRETKEGHHKLVCRVHKHDGTPTSTIFELGIEVKLMVSNGPPDGSAAPY